MSGGWERVDRLLRGDKSLLEKLVYWLFATAQMVDLGVVVLVVAHPDRSVFL